MDSETGKDPSKSPAQGRSPRPKSQLGLAIRRGVGFALIFVVLTWLFFAPVAAFHHIVACGVLAPVVLNGETPQGDRLLWGKYEVRFFPGRFAVSTVLWIASLAVAYKFLHRKITDAPVSTDGGQPLTPESTSLPIPRELTDLISTGFWPRDWDQALAQHLRPLVPKSSVRRFAPEEDQVFLFPPPFLTVRQRLKPEEMFWTDPQIAVHEIDPDLTLLIGDFGLGSDAPIVLDYRDRPDEPRVIRLRWAADGNHWVEIAPTFAAFAAYLRP